MNRGLRLRRRVGDNFGIVVGVVLVVGALGGYLTYTTYVDPGTHTETREVSSWQSTGEFTHHATVVNGTAAFEEGTTLRNRTVYFSRTTPNLNGTFTYTYAATEGGSLDVNATISLVLRSTTQDEGDESTTTYWRIGRTLDEEGVESLSPGERLRVPFSLNVSAVADEVQRVDEQLGGTPGQLDIEVVTQIEATGTRNGQPATVSRTYGLPISPDSGVYRVEDPGAVQASDTETSQVTVQNTYGPLRTAGGPVLVVLALAGLVGLGYARWTGVLSVSDRERTWLTYQSDRAEFDEWITTGTVRTDARGSMTAETDSLAGLVDIAIDTDSRVIEDTEMDAFFVFGDDQRFRYDPPPGPPLSVDDRQASNVDPLESGQVAQNTAEHTDGEAGEQLEDSPGDQRAESGTTDDAGSGSTDE